MAEENQNTTETTAENTAPENTAPENTAPAENTAADNQPQENGGEDKGNDEGKSEEPQDGASKIADAIDKLGITADADQKKEEPNVDEQPKAAEDAAKPQDDAQKKQAQPQDNDEELLRGVNERGRERLRKLLSDGRESSRTLNAIQNAIAESGLDRESFGNLLTISRLVSSQNVGDVEQGLKMLENVRTALYQNLGRDLPGTDPLQRFDDLRQKVANMEMSRDDAVLVANARRRQAAEQAARQQAVAQQREAQAVSARIETAKAQAMERINRHSGEADFQARVAAVTRYFQQPGRLQEFVRTHAPETWSDALEFMYSSVQAAPAPRSEGPGPITSGRARAAGHRVSTMPGSAESIAARLAELGI
jgi:hypothetical protein